MSNATTSNKQVATETPNQEVTAMNRVAQNIAELNRVSLDDDRPIGEAISSMAQTVKYRHGDFARAELGMAIYDAFHKGGIQPMEEAWERIIQHLEKEHQAYAHTLLAHPRVSNQQVRQLQMSPIVLAVGEARTLTPVETLADLRTLLRAESGLRQRVYEEGQDAYFAKAARQIWAEMPNQVKAAVFGMLSDPMFVEPEKIAKVNGVKKKASAVKGIEALEKADASTWWAARAGQWTVRALFQLAFRWANSASFWADIIRPTAPWVKDRSGETQPDDESYAGEEVKAYDGPFSTFQPGGSTLQELHEDRLRCIDEVQAEFEAASEMAEEWLTPLKDVAAKYGIEAPLHFIRNEDGSFTPILNEDEALGMLQAKEDRAAVRRVKMEGGEQTVNNRAEARQQMLDQITDPAIRAQVEAELIRAEGGEA